MSAARAFSVQALGVRRCVYAAVQRPLIRRLSQRPDLSHPNWGLKLAHENGYLSWTRNSVITTIAAAAFYNIEPIASAGLFGMGSVFMLTGTAQYWHQLYHLRRVIPLPWSSVVGLVSMSSAIVTLWILAIVSLLDDVPTEFQDNKLLQTHFEKKKAARDAHLITMLSVEEVLAQEHRVLADQIELLKAAEECKSWWQARDPDLAHAQVKEAVLYQALLKHKAKRMAAQALQADPLQRAQHPV